MASVALLTAVPGESSSQVTTSFGYDALGRLVSVSKSDGASTTYSFDPAGNRTALASSTPQPTAAPVSMTVPYNTAASVSLAPGGSFTGVIVTSNPAYGAVTLSGSSATYTPAAGYYGSDSFSYAATGPYGTSAPATVSVSVTSPGVPTAVPVSLNVAYNTSGTVALSPGGIYSSLSIAAGPVHGSASIASGNASYTPNAGYYGSDSFTYTATGPGGTSAPASVSVTVGVPGAPTAAPVALTVPYNSSGSVALGPGGVYSSLTIAAGPMQGSASIAGGNASYTPNAGFYGSDSFTYIATGPGGNSAPASVSVTVGVPAAPTATPAALTVAYNSSGSVALALGGVYSSLAIASAALNGAASISGSNVNYVPNTGFYGSDSFTYTASGPGGTSAPATVSITVNPPPAPGASNLSLTTAYNTAGAIALAPSGVFSGVAIASGPAHGSASLSGMTATYTPVSGYSGADSFTYNATGPGGTSGPATVSVTVTPPAPILVTLSTSTWSGRTYKCGSGANDTYNIYGDGAVTSAVSGGSNIGYSWQFVSGNSLVRARDPSASATQFYRSGNTLGSSTAVFQLVVTANGQTVTSSQVTVTASTQNGCF